MGVVTNVIFQPERVCVLSYTKESTHRRNEYILINVLLNHKYFNIRYSDQLVSAVLIGGTRKKILTSTTTIIILK